MCYVLDDHDEEGQFDAKGLFGVFRTGHEGGCDVCAHDFENARLDVGVRQSFDVPVFDWVRENVLLFSQIWSGLLPIE